MFVATLGWSRATYLEFVTDERLETPIAVHKNAFLAFGGVLREVFYDNMRTVVLERNAYGRGCHRFQTGFLAFARPSQLGQEGLVLDREAANLAVGRWLCTVANQRALYDGLSELVWRHINSI